ncbi:metalloregulator ArsR/SmtB family transcription factor [Rhodococcus sp. PAE-6]|uniref:ArsR/SmtB family transcription factor n=1 Tax=Rhodococcus sp. PAE-6 TaxID=2972477 RepID=UPI0021B34CF7|nr:metalloregulator ArsR/SmtB family transcription factor [Rhodococcus sp. PAE-6]MCT7293630.1 metalloregulator ArsR/SmtB family transcription factor [Rhodococcus sp. PAE-6]
MSDRSALNPSEAAKAAAALKGPDIEGWAARFEMLSEPNRLRILHCLHHIPGLCVSDLAAAVGMSPTAVSQALRLLRQRGLVSYTRMGRIVRYQLSDDPTHSLLHQMGAVHGHNHHH